MVAPSFELRKSPKQQTLPLDHGTLAEQVGSIIKNSVRPANNVVKAAFAPHVRRSNRLTRQLGQHIEAACR